MGKYTFTDAGKKFTVIAAGDISPEQVKAAFDKQAATGSLVGLKPGETLSAETQAAQGLSSAAAAASENLKKAGKSLTQGLSNLAGGVTKSVGKIGTSLKKGLKNFGSGLKKTGQGIGKGISSGISNIGSSLGGAVTKIGGVIADVPIGNGITVGDFARGTTALLGIGSMTQSETTATLAQTANNTGQAAGDVSNSKGVGSYGLSVGQLESAGYVRPGNAALVNQNNSAVSVLKSPAVWTGKDGIKSLDDMLANNQIQSKIQQTTMVQGLAGLAAVGLAVGGGSDAIVTASLALAAAKGIQDAAAYFKNKPVPNDANGAKTAALNETVRNGSYAVSFTQEKVAETWKAEDKPVPAVNTNNRETVDAASKRIVGDPKVPEPTYTAPETTIDTDGVKVVNGFIDEYGKVTNKFNADLKAIRADKSQTKLDSLLKQETLRIDYLRWQTAFREKVREYWYQLLQYVGIAKGKTTNRELFEKNKKAFDNLYALVKRLNEEIKGMEVKIYDLRDDIQKL